MASEVSLSLEDLSVIAWACAASVPDLVTLLRVQTEARACWRREQDLPWRGDSAQHCQHLLTITWACSFAESLTAAFRCFVEECVPSVGRRLDATAEASAAPAPAPASSGDAPAVPAPRLEETELSGSPRPLGLGWNNPCSAFAVCRMPGPEGRTSSGRQACALQASRMGSA